MALFATVVAGAIEWTLNALIGAPERRQYPIKRGNGGIVLLLLGVADLTAVEALHGLLVWAKIGKSALGTGNWG